MSNNHQPIPFPTITGSELALQKKWLDKCLLPGIAEAETVSRKTAYALVSVIRQAHATIDELVEVIKSAWVVRVLDENQCAYCNGKQPAADGSKKFPHDAECIVYTLRPLQD